MKVIAIIQARLGSQRLPGKIMLPLAGKPAIQHVIERAELIPNISKVVVAIPAAVGDDPLARFCKAMNVPVFQGSEEDVLDRYYRAALLHEADAIVRITGDCPLLDPIESGKVIRMLLERGVDYVSNSDPPGLPDGLDTEALSMKVLKRVWEKANKKSEREHVTLYIRSNPGEFRIGAVLCSEQLGQYRLTLDEMADYILLGKLFSILKVRGQFGHLNEVMTILKSDPELFKMNGHIQRNEGLFSSLRKD